MDPRSFLSSSNPFSSVQSQPGPPTGPSILPPFFPSSQPLPSDLAFLSVPFASEPLASNQSATSAIWKELLDPSGQTYWWNSVTRDSRWEKPEELKTDYERMENSQWQEYTDDGGRKYYHNRATNETTWVQPEEYRSFLERLEKRRKDAEEANSSPLDKMLKSVYPDEPTKHQYAVLLTERHMNSAWTWDQAVSATFEDERSKALKMAERKLVYQLLVSKLKVLESEEKRSRERKLVADYFSMLDEWVDQDRYSSYKDMCERFTNDHRFISISNESQRTRLFGEYKSQKERSERDKANAELDLKVNKFKIFLSHSPVHAGSLWSDLLESHSSEPTLLALEPLDRIKAFMDYTRSLDKSEENARLAERKKLRSLASKSREAFRSLLAETLPSTSIECTGTHPNWFAFQPTLLSDSRYQALLSTTGSTPAELYYDFLSSMEAHFIKDKRKVKTVVRSIGLRILLFSATDASDSPHRPEDMHAVTFETASKLDFAVWAQKIRPFFPGLDDTALLRIYEDFGSRELSKAKGRTLRTFRRLVDALKVKLATTPELSLDLDLARQVLEAVEGHTPLTSTECELALKAAVDAPHNTATSAAPKARDEAHYDLDDHSSDEELAEGLLESNGGRRSPRPDLGSSPRKSFKFDESSSPHVSYSESHAI